MKIKANEYLNNQVDFQILYYIILNVMIISLKYVNKNHTNFKRKLQYTHRTDGSLNFFNILYWLNHDIQ